jgi:RNA polymerase sigma-70 factor (ECF subfamily)
MVDVPVEDRDPTTREAIDAALETLPERQRTALLLADHAGLPHAEIATVLGITPGASKVLVHRARLSFRKTYEGTSA